MSVKKAGELLVCTLIAVHMATIFIISIPNTIFYHKLPKLVLDYTNQMGLRNSWNMFAPDPAPEQKIELQYFTNLKSPPEIVIEQPEGTLYSLSRIRRFYVYNYFLASDERIFKELEPVACRGKTGGYWTLKTWAKLDRKNYVLTRDMMLDCSSEDSGRVKN